MGSGESLTGNTYMDIALAPISAPYYAMTAIKNTADMLKPPEMPEPPKPEAPVEKGEEGIRRGSMQRQAKRRALGQAYLTRGQERATVATLGGQREMLG